jgi:hypothetical protein
MKRFGRSYWRRWRRRRELALWGRIAGIGEEKAQRIVDEEMRRLGWGSGLWSASERGPAEGEDRAAIAAGDDNDIEMDSRPVKNGDMDACDQPALPPEKVNLCQYSGLTLSLTLLFVCAGSVSLLRTDPLANPNALSFSRSISTGRPTTLL